MVAKRASPGSALVGSAHPSGGQPVSSATVKPRSPGVQQHVESVEQRRVEEGAGEQRDVAGIGLRGALEELFNRLGCEVAGRGEETALAPGMLDATEIAVGR